MRAVEAKRLENEKAKADPEYAAFIEARREERRKEEFETESRKRQDEFHSYTPWALKKMGLEKLELDTLAALEERDLVPVVRKWVVDKTRPMIVLTGPSRSGKTIAACSALLECKRWIRCESFHAETWRPELGRFVKAEEIARLSYFDSETRDEIELLQSVQLLILDDLGAEQASSTWASTLGGLVDARLRQGGRTIITTNLGGAEFKARYDGRVMSRLRECNAFLRM